MRAPLPRSPLWVKRMAQRGPHEKRKKAPEGAFSKPAHQAHGIPVVELMRKTANSTSTANRASIQLDTCVVRVSKNWFVVVGTCQK